MTAQILALKTAMTVDRAWRRYAEAKQREVENPALAFDREHCQTVALAYHDWRILFLESERPT